MTHCLIDQCCSKHVSRSSSKFVAVLLYKRILVSQIKSSKKIQDIDNDEWSNCYQRESEKDLNHESRTRMGYYVL